MVVDLDRAASEPAEADRVGAPRTEIEVIPKNIVGRPALDTLGQALFEELEHLDPNDERAWAALSEREKDLYRLAIGGVLEAHADTAASLLGDLPGRDIWEQTGWRKGGS